MYPKVSIIIPFYNCSYVDQAIESALAQTYPNIEIIVVDDGSTMHTEKIDPYMDKIILVKKMNGGTATALNHGIREATGEYISWLSSDDYFFPDKTIKQATAMISQNMDVSFSNYDIMDGSGVVTIPSACMHPFSERDLYQAFMYTNPINGCTVMMKKDVLQKVGYFNPNYRYTQDYEMWFRILTSGIKIHYLHDVLVRFRRHDASGTNKHQYEMQQEMALLESQYRPIVLKQLLSL